MKRVRCQVCGEICVKNGNTKAGSQRWLCKKCGTSMTNRIDNTTKQFHSFKYWLFGKQTQKEMPGEGRSFRRNMAKFWDIWPMPPIIEDSKDIVFVDGIYLGRKACILICCDKEHVLGWYLCRYEHSRAWISLMSRIATPRVVVSDGGSGFAKAAKKAWKGAKIQRCTFHAAAQVKRYTTQTPKTAAGFELKVLANDLMKIREKSEAEKWVDRFVDWHVRYKNFLSQKTKDEFGKERYTHERLIKAKNSLDRLLREKTLFTYLDEELRGEIEIPATNNRIEGGVNAQLRAMLREHRGLSLERRIKAVYWWCYLHSPKPLSPSEMLKVMPTDHEIAEVYKRLTNRQKLEDSIPTWGDAIVWSEFHNYDKFINRWD